MILFLDFDGVTHPQPCGDESVFCRLHLIESVLRERELRDVQIVVSSSWREHHSLDDMREFFSLDTQSRVIGVTPNLWDQALAPAFVRERECMAWLATNRPPGPCRASRRLKWGHCVACFGNDFDRRLQSKLVFAPPVSPPCTGRIYAF